jgi:NAD(P)-dependent dehydrogenase (short-subunit alcohol dehydrogenase family)
LIKKILITGASSGLGWALAKGYDSENIILGLIGRNKENLLKLQKELNCRSQILVADVAKPNSMRIAANTFKKKYGSPDIIIANAGVSSGTLASKKEDLEVIHKIFQINFHGVLNTFNPFMDDLLKSKQGQLSFFCNFSKFSLLRPTNPKMLFSESYPFARAHPKPEEAPVIKIFLINRFYCCDRIESIIPLVTSIAFFGPPAIVDEVMYEPLMMRVGTPVAPALRNI